jgi:hypothetical protein
MTAHRGSYGSAVGEKTMNSEGQLLSTVIRMEITEDDSIFVAQSPDLHGLIVTAHNLGGLFKALPEAIEKHYRANGVRVIAARARAELPGYTAFVTMPVDLAENALRRAAELV